MAVFISKAEDVFDVSGRGCIVVPGLPLDLTNVDLKVGDRIVLRRPDGTEIETTLRGVQMGSRHPSGCVPLLLGKELSKEMIPIGTELWVA